MPADERRETPPKREPDFDTECPDGMPIMIVYGVGEGREKTPFYARLCNDYATLTYRDLDTREVWYNLFSRAERRIVRTRDIDEYLRAIEALPDGVAIESISRCTVSFGIDYVSHPNGEFEQVLLPGLDRIIETFKRKRIKLIGFGDEETLPHKPHFLDLCRSWFKVLDSPLPNDAPPPTPVPKEWQ